MNEVTKQSLLDLLAAAKTHIEAGETEAAVEKIEEAVVTIENEGVETANNAPSDAGGEDGNNPENPPLPGTGNNGRL